MAKYDKDLIFDSITSSRTREDFEITPDMIEIGKMLGRKPAMLRALYKAIRGLEPNFEYKPTIGAALIGEFDYNKKTCALHYLDLTLKFTVEALFDYLGIIDSVYSSIYPIGTVVALDLELLPEPVRSQLSDGPGALVSLTGRKIPLREGFEDYIVDYVGRLWPFGEMPGTEPILVSNMMIEHSVQLGYRDELEDQFAEDVLRATQLSHQQVSTAFMRPDDMLRYYEPMIKEVAE